MIYINKLFENSIGLSGIKDIRFIEDTKENKGINLIYINDTDNIKLPKLKEVLEKDIKIAPKFLSSYNKRLDFYYGVIPPNIYFRNQKIISTTYAKWIKKEYPKIKWMKQFIANKSDINNKSVFYDISFIYNTFFNFYNKSEFIAAKELIKILSNIISESKTSYYQRPNYIILDLNNYGTRDLINLFFNYYKLNKNIFPDSFISDFMVKGIIVKIDGLFWPFGKIIQKNNTDHLEINYQVYNKIKEIKHPEEIEKIITKNKLEKINKVNYDLLDNEKKLKKQTEDILNNLQDIDQFLKKTKTIGDLRSEEDQKELNKLLDKAQNQISKSEISGNSFDEKISEIEKHPEFKKYKKILQNIKEINKKYNGVISVDENLIKQVPSYYNPLDIVKIKDFHAFDKQRTEFDEVLDESMMDLFNSIEQDPEAGIKVQKISIKFQDNFKSRYKIYSLKIKNTKFGYGKSYNIEFKVPYPINGKYLKLDGNKYIMINQFFPRPIVKVEPHTVRIYTHFSTAAVELKGTSLNKTSDFDRFKKEFIKIMTEIKKIESTKEIDSDKITYIKEKYNLPDNLNPELMFNIKIK